jgi:predicted RNA-binding Zn ribbon-like protein
MRYIRGMRLPADDGSSRRSVLTTARRTADLVNVLTAEGSPPPETVAAVLRQYGENLAPGEPDRADVNRMRTTATLLRKVFTADSADEAAAVLNHLLHEHTGALRLTSHGGHTPWHPHLDGDDDAPWEEWLLASSCMALAVLLWDRQHPPGRACASPSCHHVFIARGSGPERRYCSRRCATRERVAAHRRARAAPPSDA